MGRRAVQAALVAVLAVAVVAPVAPVAAQEDDPVQGLPRADRRAEEAVADADRVREELDGARRELEGVQGELAWLDEVVGATASEVEELDAALLDASSELAAVEQQLADVQLQLATAEEAFADALDAERAAAQALIDADGELEALLDDWQAHRDRLAERAVHAYKHGSASPQELFVRGMIGAADWHQVAVTLETVGRVAAEDRDLVDASAGFTRSTADARAMVRTARIEAIDASEHAEAHQTRVEAEQARVIELLAQQVAAVDDVDARLREREALLDRLEADTAVRAGIVAELEARIDELEEELAIAAASVFRPVDVDLDVFGPPPEWAVRLPEAGRRWAAPIEAIAARHGLDGRLLAAVVWTESNFRPDAVSHAGATGLAQLMPGTARGLGVDPWDPLENLDGGARYLRTQLERFERVDLALAAYNAGPGRVVGAGNAIPNIVETQLYVVRVLDRYRSIAG